MARTVLERTACPLRKLHGGHAGRSSGTDMATEPFLLLGHQFLCFLYTLVTKTVLIKQRTVR